MTDGAQAIFVALAHGVAVYPDGRGGVSVSAVAAPIPAAGVEYLKRHKAEILKAFDEIGVERVLQVHLMEYGRRLGSELVEEYRAMIAATYGNKKPSLPEFVTAWALVLHCDALKSWPE